MDFGYDVRFGMSPFMIAGVPANFWAEETIDDLVKAGGRP